MLPAACIVPESSARPGWVFPLVALFSPLVYLCPVPEISPQETGPVGLVQDGRLIALCPPMPTAAAEKLRHLARSLAGSGAVQHGEQLKQLILESLSTESNQEAQEASSALRRQLRTGIQNSAGGADTAPEAGLLWQERLLLLLADRAEREQEELAAAISRISRQHQELLSSLSDKGDSPEDVLQGLVPPEALTSHTTWQPKRLQAWVRLLVQTTLPRQDMWYITRQKGLAEQIMEQHQLCAQGETQQACQAYHLPDLLLPACPQEENSERPVLLVSLEQDCPDLLAAFSGLQALALGATADELPEAAKRFAEAAAVWNAMVSAATPAVPATAAHSGLSRLQLSILPGASFLQRLQNSLACPPASAKDASSVTDTGQGLCLFGLMLSDA
ncbi:MAG: hypothetical protein Q4G66_01975 [bacterium]|nr:hypothetical protein [bacterium]